MIQKLQNLGIETHGRTSGQLKTKCPKCYNGKPSNLHDLSVNLDTGEYNCHNDCGFKGNLSYLPMKKEKQYTVPVFQNNTALSENVVKWFSARSISQKTLIEMKVTQAVEYMPQVQKKCNVIQFNYFENGELVNVKSRDPNKFFKLSSGAKLVFYNIDSLKGSKVAICVEGEIDALSYIEVGLIPVISVPNGASKGSLKLEYLDNCWEAFKDIETIYLATDNDEAGITLRNELARRLGIERCKWIDFRDCKDANEYLIKHGRLELLDTIKEAKDFPIKGIVFANEISDAVDDFYENGFAQTKKLGIAELDDLISFDDDGAFVIFTGTPTHGKSEFIDMIVVLLNILYNWKVGVFSPENFPLKFHISKFSEKIIGKSFLGKNRMSIEEKNMAKEHIDKNFFFIRPDDENYSIETILEKAKILVLRYGIKILIIDPYNRLEHHLEKGEQETLYISKLLDKITLFKQKYGVHVFLVAHPKKMLKKKNSAFFEVPNLYDISGSSNFFNKAEMGGCVYRNYQSGQTEIYIQKIKFKHWGSQGKVELHWNYNNGRYYLNSPDNSNWLLSPPKQEKKQEVIESTDTDIDPF